MSGSSSQTLLCSSHRSQRSFVSTRNQSKLLMKYFRFPDSHLKVHICQNSTFPPLLLKSLYFVLFVWHPAQTVRLLLLLSFTKFTPLPPVSDQGFGGQHVPGNAVSKSLSSAFHVLYCFTRQLPF